MCDAEKPDKTILSSGNFWYQNNCFECGRYNKKPIYQNKFYREYICEYANYKSHLDYRCYNADMFTRADNFNRRKEVRIK